MAQKSDSPPAVTPLAEVEAEFRQEFHDEFVELLEGLDVELDAARNGRQPAREVIDHVRRLAMRYQGPARHAGYPLAETLLGRLDDYLSELISPLPPRIFDDLQTFLDRLLGVVNQDIDPETDASELVRTLPAKAAFNVGDIEIRNIEVMLVMTPSVQTRFIERELQQCGYRTVIVASAFDAFQQIVRTKPDLVIISAVMPELSGINLAIALAAMPETRNVPAAIITSLADSDDHLRLLPPHYPVIHKGPNFADDLFAALDRLFLI